MKLVSSMLSRSRLACFVLPLAGLLLCAGGVRANGRTEVVDQSNPPAQYGAVNIGSDFGFILGQSFVPTATNLTSVEIYFADNTPVDQETPVRVTIWKSESLDFTSGILIGTVVQLVPEGPGVDRGLGPRVNQSSAVFPFEPALPMEPGEVYVIQVAEDQFPSNTDLSWRAGQAYPYGVGIKDGAPTADRAFQTFTDPDMTSAKRTTWGALKVMFD
jgi:hypothetical protein